MRWHYFARSKLTRSRIPSLADLYRKPIPPDCARRQIFRQHMVGGTLCQIVTRTTTGSMPLLKPEDPQIHSLGLKEDSPHCASLSTIADGVKYTAREHHVLKACVVGRPPPPARQHCREGKGLAKRVSRLRFMSQVCQAFFESGRALASCHTRAAALGGLVYGDGVARK